MITLMFLWLFGLLSLFWFSDEILTKLDIKKFGLKSEGNPIIQRLEKKGELYVFGFKLSCLGVVLLAAYAIFLVNATLSYWLLGGLSLVYFLVVLHNFELYERY